MTLRRIRPSIPPQQLSRSKTKIGGNMAHKQTTDGEAHRPPSRLYSSSSWIAHSPHSSSQANHISCESSNDGPVQLRPAPGGAGASPSVLCLAIIWFESFQVGWDGGMGKLLEPSWKGRNQNEVHRPRGEAANNAIGFVFSPKLGNGPNIYISISISAIVVPSVWSFACPHLPRTDHDTSYATSNTYQTRRTTPPCSRRPTPPTPASWPGARPSPSCPNPTCRWTPSRPSGRWSTPIPKHPAWIGGSLPTPSG